MASPLDADWNNNLISDDNLNKTTIGNATSFPSTWRTDRLFFRSDQQKLYKNTGTESSPSWQEMGASGVTPEMVVMKYTTTPADYTYATLTSTSSNASEWVGSTSTGSQVSVGEPNNRFKSRFDAGSDLLGLTVTKLKVYARLSSTSHGTNQLTIQCCKGSGNSGGSFGSFRSNETTPTISTGAQWLEKTLSTSWVVEEGDGIGMKISTTGITGYGYRHGNDRDNEVTITGGGSSVCNPSSPSESNNDMSVQYYATYSGDGANMSGGKWESTSGAGNYVQYDMGSNFQLSGLMVNLNANNTAEKFEVQVAEGLEDSAITINPADSTVSGNHVNFYYGNESHRYRKYGVTVSNDDLEGKKIKKIEIYGRRSSGSGGQMKMVIEGGGGEIEESTNSVSVNSFGQTAHWGDSSSTQFLFDGKKKISNGDKIYLYAYDWSSGCCDDFRVGSTSDGSLGSGLKQDIGDLGSTTWDSATTPAFRIYTEGEKAGTFQTVRTLNASQLTTGQNNFVRFNPKKAQFLKLIDKTAGQASSSPTYTEDMSDTSGWSFADTGKINVTGGVLDFDLERNSSNDSASYDFGSAVSDTVWRLRFKINFNKVSGGSSNGNYGFVGLSDSNSGTSQTSSQDFIGWYQQLDNTSYIHAKDTDGDSLSTSGEDGQQFTPTLNTDYFIDIIRSSATAYSVTWRTGSYDGSVAVTTSGTCTSGTSGLRYFVIRNLISGNAGRDTEGTIDDIQLWNNTTDTVTNPKVVAITEMKVQANTDEELGNSHGHLASAISTTSTSISLSGE